MVDCRKYSNDDLLFSSTRSINERSSQDCYFLLTTPFDYTQTPFRIRCQCLTELQAAFVECKDLTDGSCGGGAKLELVVVSAKFEGLALLKRHRLVNDCLAEFMPQIHAITMKTWTPQQYESKK
jgi:stress-induced morphogen